MAMAQDSSHPTGVAKVNDVSTSKELTRARDRKANAALDMAIHGADWDQIAEVIGYPTARAAKVAVELALEKNLSSVDKQKMRLLIQARYNKMVQSVAGKATDETHPEHLAALGRYREITADVRRMWGLDAPQEVLVTNPTQREIDDWVGITVSQSIPQVEEDDIVDAEVIDDEAV
jgi:hypothetical protein